MVRAIVMPNAGWFCKQCHDTHRVLYQVVENGKKKRSYCFRCVPPAIKVMAEYMNQIGEKVEPCDE